MPGRKSFRETIEMKRLVLLTLMCLPLSGCGDDQPDGDEVVAIETIPANLMDIAKKELPGIKFTEAFKMKVDGKDAFEIRGKDNRGKVREIELTTTGEIIEIE